MDAEGGKSFFRHRFGAKRFQKVASGLTPRQRGFVVKHGFGHLLSISDFNVPIIFLEWIMRNVSPLLCEFRYRGKSICFTKGMVQKVLGIPSGEKPLKTGGMQKDIRELRDMYRVEKRAPISKAIEVMIGSDDEDIFMRSFMLVALATVLSPGTGNMVHLDYLFSLVDISEIGEYDWAGDILYVLMKEVERYQQLTPEQRSNPFLIGGCLPLLVIIYMDYLDLPSGPLQDHAINYSCPRICHICDADFAFVEKADKNRLSLNNTNYGTRPFRELACTPYQNVPSKENTASVDSASLEEWLRMSQSSSQCSQFPKNIQEIIEKHDKLWAKDMEAVVATLKSMHTNRTTALIAEVRDALAPNVGGQPSDVCFQAGGGSTVGGTAGVAATNVKSSQANVSKADFVDVNRVVGTPPRGQTIVHVTPEDNINSPNSLDDGKFVEQVAGESPIISDRRCASPTMSDRHRASQNIDCIVAKLCLNQRDSARQGTTSYVQDVGSPAGRVEERTSPSRSDTSHWPAYCKEDPDFNLFKVGEPGFIDLFESNNVSHSSPATSQLIFSEDVAAAVIIPVHSPTTSKLSENASGSEKHIDVSSGPSTHEKKNRKKRAAKTLEDGTKLKKFKVDPIAEDIYAKYISTRCVKKAKKGVVPPPFVEISGFNICYDHFYNSLKPRGDIDNELMTLFVEQFNEDAIKLLLNKTSPKKFSFTPVITSQLLMDPENFMPQSCMRVMERIDAKYKLAKKDLLFFPIVRNKHWVLLCVNILHSQVNLFDSIKNSRNSDAYSAANNLIANFSKLVNVSKVMKKDISKFQRCSPTEYPQQSTLFDCGVYTMTFMENWDGKTLKPFLPENIPDFRKVVASRLIKSPLNVIDSSFVLRGKEEQGGGK